MIRRVYKAAEYLINEGKFIVTLGGEHSISSGVVQAMKQKYHDCCVLQLDAHTDLRDEYTNTKYSHACVMRRIAELCPITQVGIRSSSIEELNFLQDNNMTPFYLTSSNPRLSSIQQIIDSLSNNVYVTIDLDVLDPSIMSAVGTPEPGGLLWHEIISLIAAVAQSKSVIGFDIVELCPSHGPDACAFLAAKLTYAFIGYIFH
jgi:agmatinase